MPSETPSPKAPLDGDSDLGTRFAWQVHEAVQGWTESVDVKTSIVLIVEIAIAGAAASSLIAKGGESHGAVGLHLATSIAAIATLVAAVGAALWVVFPRLARQATAESTRGGLIYFGHLQGRPVHEIESALADLTKDEERHQLASQLRITARVAWQKHLWLQRSLFLLMVGSGLFLLSLVAFN